MGIIRDNNSGTSLDTHIRLPQDEEYERITKIKPSEIVADTPIKDESIKTDKTTKR